MVSHHVIIRFKTYLENGILLAVGIVGKDFLILELHKGSLRMAIDLGGGEGIFQITLHCYCIKNRFESEAIVKLKTRIHFLIFGGT